MKNEHPFFCEAKGCRKSAWATPECMRDEDWELLARLRNVKTPAEFSEIVYESRDTAEAFFYRTIGWPEGMSYMRDAGFAEQTGWQCLNNPKHGGLTMAIAALGQYEQRRGATAG